ncbi:MAG: hypothetical protein IJ801_02620, partial [Lachnospiraceae bacterium]|nr:hypothetical protein [Lachnospiraceae bacterium]
MHYRRQFYPIAREQEVFMEIFSPEALTSAYLEGHEHIRRIFFSRRTHGQICFVELTAIISRHPITGHIIAFLTEQECNDDKVKQTIINKILANQFDMIAYLSNGHYHITIGDGALITRGSIFPKERQGDYWTYISEQVIPVLHGDAEQKENMAASLMPETIAKEIKRKVPYEANIICDVDGDVFYKRFDFYLVDEQAEFYIILKSDTTAIQREQEARNEQLRNALEQANQANVAKTAFLSSMSHEIRTPMNAIIGLDTIALSDPELPERTREHLEKIGGSARHLLGLINDILDMSRIESGRMTLNHAEFSFREMLEQINTMINGQCQDKGLTYECKIRGKVDDYYIGDDMKLKQVIINILGNAVKFTSAPGNVTFVIEPMNEFDDQVALRFIMKDTGIGMDKEYLPKIFEAFSQEDENKANKYGSTGLGMSITRNIVEMMNGTISVDSEKGNGSTFTVNITLKKSYRKNETVSDILPKDLDVLVIDDDPVALEHARVVLGDAGIRAETCTNEEEALD